MASSFRDWNSASRALERQLGLALFCHIARELREPDDVTRVSPRIGSTTALAQNSVPSLKPPALAFEPAVRRCRRQRHGGKPGSAVDSR